MPKFSTRHLDNTCEISGCDRPCWKRVCAFHAEKMRWGDIPADFGIQPNPPCPVDGCQRRALSKKTPLCRAHHAIEKAGRPPESKRSDSRTGPPPTPRATTYVPLAPGDRALQPCAIEGCSTTTAGTHCRRHRDQLAQYGMTWLGKRPTDELRARREAARPECFVLNCTQKVSSAKSDVCRYHRSDRARKGCSPEFYRRLMSITACESCGQGNVQLVVDHDHRHPHADKDGMCEQCIRGRICLHCNSALGFLRDDAEHARKVIAYMERMQTRLEPLAA